MTTLKKELEAARKEIKTDSYPISIRELASLYKEGEIDLHPEFQRFLRWSPEQKTKLIESILLGIPVPSIFLYQRNDGVLDLVDGLQRVSTILHFMGELKDEDGKKLPYLRMGKAHYLPHLEDKVWQSDNKGEDIGDDIQKFFRQGRMDVQILLRDSDEQHKLELFQRINTGGTPLSDQEVRNCILIMVNRRAYFWLENLAKDVEFQSCCPIPEQMRLERYDLELILRFCLLHRISIDNLLKVDDLGQFLTSEMRIQFAKDAQDLDSMQDVFYRVFYILNKSCDDNALRKYNSKKSKFTGPFLISAFELIALGVAWNIDYVESKGHSWLKGRIKAIWEDPRADGIYGQGVSTARRLPKTLEVGRKFFSES